MNSLDLDFIFDLEWFIVDVVFLVVFLGWEGIFF